MSQFQASSWVYACKNTPCPVCGRPKQCRIATDGVRVCCYKVADGGRERQDKNGAPFWVHELEESARPAPAVAPVYRTEPASPSVIHSAYRELFARLVLSEAHEAALLARGIDAQLIKRHGFRTWPSTMRERSKVGLAVADLVGQADILGVPGFIAPKGSALLAGPPGALAVPYFDLSGRLTAVRLRREHAEPGEARYCWATSASRGGPGPQMQPFWSCNNLLKAGEPVTAPRIRLTEGELKAAVSASLTGVFTVAVPGVSMWRLAVPMLKHLRPSEVLLAFDMDRRTNQVVARAVVECFEELPALLGVQVELESWDEKHKGIDDHLLALWQAQEVA